MVKMKVSVIAPVYNEAENVESFIESLLKQIGKDDEIVVVDDNSPDGTWKKVEEFGKKDKRVRLLNRLNKRGLASAIRDGVELATGDVFVWLDADMDTSLIKEMIKSMEEYDVVVASRYVKGGKDSRGVYRVITSFLIHALSVLLLDPRIHDYTTGYVAVKRSVYEKTSFTDKGYGEYCIEFLYKCAKAGYKIKEIPFDCTPRVAGQAKAFPKISSHLRHIWGYGMMILKLSLKT